MYSVDVLPITGVYSVGGDPQTGFRSGSSRAESVQKGTCGLEKITNIQDEIMGFRVCTAWMYCQ